MKDNVSVSLRIVGDTEGFRELREPWDGLLERSRSASVFLTWEWLYTWWEIYGEGKRLRIIVAEEDGEITGIAPFCSARTPFFGEEISFIGGTDTCSEYLDIIAAPGREEEIIRRMLDLLYGPAGLKWEVLSLVSLREDAGIMRWGKKYFEEKGLRCQVRGATASPFIPLPSSLDEYMKTLSRDKRYKFPKYREKLQQAFPVSFTGITEPAGADRGFDDFLRIHAKRWEGRQGNESFSGKRENFLRFHKRIVPLFSGRGWLHLVFLKAGGETIAGQCNYRYAGKIYGYSLSFDPRWASYRAGSVLQLMVLEDAIGKQCREYDFLRGTEEYKYSWTKHRRISSELRVWRSAFAYRANHFGQTLRHAVKGMLPAAASGYLYRRFVEREEL